MAERNVKLKILADLKIEVFFKKKKKTLRCYNNYLNKLFFCHCLIHPEEKYIII